MDEIDHKTVNDLLDDVQNLLTLRAAKAEEADAESVSLDDAKKMLGIT